MLCHVMSSCYVIVHCELLLQGLLAHPLRLPLGGRRVAAALQLLSVYLSIYRSIYLSIYLCTYVRTYVCNYIYIYIYIHMYTYIRTYVRTYIHTYIHSYIHIYIYIYIHIKLLQGLGLLHPGAQLRLQLLRQVADPLLVGLAALHGDLQPRNSCERSQYKLSYVSSILILILMLILILILILVLKLIRIRTICVFFFHAMSLTGKLIGAVLILY